MEYIEIKFGDEKVVLQCDLARAESPLVVDGTETGYRTADARHRAPNAVLLVARLVWPDVQWPDVPTRGSDKIVTNEAWDALGYETVDHSRLALEWARTAEAGDYLAEYDEDEDEDDSGSRCGYDDPTLDRVERILRERGLTLRADDTGLVAEVRS